VAIAEVVVGAMRPWQVLTVADVETLLAESTPAWFADALCVEYRDRRVSWFPGRYQPAAAAVAKAVRHRCAVQQECLSYAPGPGPRPRGCMGRTFQGRAPGPHPPAAATALVRELRPRGLATQGAVYAVLPAERRAALVATAPALYQRPRDTVLRHEVQQRPEPLINAHQEKCC
jgi:hypothetical protein